MRTGASNKQTDFREDAPSSSGKRRIVHAPPRPSDAAHLFTVSTSEADSRNGVTRGESAASFNDPTNHGDDHAKYDVLSCFFDNDPLNSRRRPQGCIPASPAGENRQVVRQAGETATLFDESGLKLKLSSTAKAVFSPKERARFNAILRGDFS